MKKPTGYTWKNDDGTYGARITFTDSEGARRNRKIGEGKNGLPTKSEADDWISACDPDDW